MIESLVSNKKDKVEDDNNREIQLIREQMELREREIEDIKRQEKQDAEDKSAEKQQKIQLTLPNFEDQMQVIREDYAKQYEEKMNRGF